MVSVQLSNSLSPSVKPRAREVVDWRKYEQEQEKNKEDLKFKRGRLIHCFIPSITEYEKHVCLICAFFLAGSLSIFPSLDLKILLVMYPYSHFCSVLSSLFRSEELCLSAVQQKVHFFLINHHCLFSLFLLFYFLVYTN